MKSTEIQNGIKDMMGKQNGLCISLIVPTHAVSRDKMVDPKLTKLLIKRAKTYIDVYTKTQNITNGDILKLKLDELFAKIDFLHTSEGIGIYISESISHIEYFPFDVKENIVTANSFEMRELLYKASLSKEYYVLVLSEKNTRLLKGHLKDLKEMRNNLFPKKYIESYEYAKPSLGSSRSPSLKQMERDKSQMEQMRMETFFHSTDKAMRQLVSDGTPLIIVGAGKATSIYKKISDHKNIIATVSGNFEHGDALTLSEKAWKAMKVYLYAKGNDSIKLLKKENNLRKISSGLRKVWRDAHVGKGLSLLVEMDFAKTAYLSLKENKLFLKRPQKSNSYHVIQDAVDDIIEEVLNKHGEVTFVPNGLLLEHDGIVMINRY